MGLAASQARFLLLTSRQSDVESQIQSISNRKLALSREITSLSSQQANAMNAQNVMWTVGSGKDATTSELQYSDIMNVGSDYVLTNAYGAVMFDENNDVFKKLGLDPNGGSGDDFVSKYPSKRDFLTTVMPGSFIAKDGGGYEQYTDGPYKGEFKYTFDSALEDEERQNKSSEKNEGSTFTVAYNEQLIRTKAGVGNLNGDNTSVGLMSSGTEDGHDDEWSVNRYYDNDTGDIKELRKGIKEQFTNIISDATGKISDITGNLSNALIEVLCTGTTEGYGQLSQFSNEITQACGWAQTATINKFTAGIVMDDSNANADYQLQAQAQKNNKYIDGENLQDNVTDARADRNTSLNELDLYMATVHLHSGVIFNSEYYKEGNVYLNKDQVVNTFLNYFDLYCEQHFSNADSVDTTTHKEGDKDVINVGSKTTDRYLTNVKESDKNKQIAAVGYNTVINDTAYDTYFGGTSGDAYNTIDGKTVGTAAGSTDPDAVYWLQMYNRLASNGWQVNNKLNDKEYLQQQVLYGNVVINKFNGYKETNELSLNDSNTPLSLEDDEDTIERENRRYEAKLDELNFKETLLENMMTSLDQERSAIETEKEGVTKMIQSNVKIFSLFKNA